MFGIYHLLVTNHINISQIDKQVNIFSIIDTYIPLSLIQEKEVDLITQLSANCKKVSVNLGVDWVRPANGVSTECCRLSVIEVVLNV